MAEEARRRNGKGTGKEGSEGSHPFKGKGKSPGKAQQKGGKGKSGPGGGPATPSAVRLDPLLALHSWKARGPTESVPQRMVEKQHAVRLRP